MTGAKVVSLSFPWVDTRLQARSSSAVVMSIKMAAANSRCRDPLALSPPRISTAPRHALAMASIAAITTALRYTVRSSIVTS